MPVTEDDDIDEETLAELEALIENLDLDDIEDLKMMAGMMHEFLILVPDIETKLEMEA